MQRVIAGGQALGLGILAELSGKGPDIGFKMRGLPTGTVGSSEPKLKARTELCHLPMSWTEAVSCTPVTGQGTIPHPPSVY
jgi:hypothetical protein